MRITKQSTSMLVVATILGVLLGLHANLDTAAASCNMFVLNEDKNWTQQPGYFPEPGTTCADGSECGYGIVFDRYSFCEGPGGETDHCVYRGDWDVKKVDIYNCSGGKCEFDFTQYYQGPRHMNSSC